MPPRLIDRPRGRAFPLPVLVYSPLAYAIAQHASTAVRRLPPRRRLALIQQLLAILSGVECSMVIRARRTSLTPRITPGSHVREAALILSLLVRHLDAGDTRRFSLRLAAGAS